MIRYYVEESLSSFEFWGDAKPFVKRLTPDELELMDDVLNDCCFEDGLSDVTINDIFAYDRSWVCECIGVAEDDIWKRKVEE